MGDPAKAESGFLFDPRNYRHPIVSDFDGQPARVQASLTGVKTFRYLKLVSPKGTTAQVALAFDKGDPAVIEVPRHRGRVVQVATSADRDWTSWPLHQSFPPVMEQIVLLAASGRFDEKNVRVGQPLSRSFPPGRLRGRRRRSRSPASTAAATMKLKAAGDVSQLDL